MKKILAVGVVVGLFCGNGIAAATESGDVLMQKSDCLVCHKTDQSLVGPSFRDIANRYKGDSAAAKTLAQKVISGGSGSWGQVPMAPHASISTADAEEIVKWILEQKS